MKIPLHKIQRLTRAILSRFVLSPARSLDSTGRKIGAPSGTGQVNKPVVPRPARCESDSGGKCGESIATFSTRRPGDGARLRAELVMCDESETKPQIGDVTMNTSIPVQSTAKPLRIANSPIPPKPAEIHSVRRPHGPSGYARWPDTVKESWETGVSLFRLASQLPLLGVIRSLSALGRAADAWHTRHTRHTGPGRK